MATVWVPEAMGNGDVDAAPPAPLARGTPPLVIATVPVVIDPDVGMEVRVTEHVEPLLIVTGTDVDPPPVNIRDRKLNEPFGLPLTRTLLHARSTK